MLLGLITPTSGDGEVLGCPISRPAAYLASGRCVERSACVLSVADRGERTDVPSHSGVSGDIPAGQRPVSSHERSCRQRIALTLRTICVFPMTHHVKCVALLEKTGSDPRRRRIAMNSSQVASRESRVDGGTERESR